MKIGFLTELLQLSVKNFDFGNCYYIYYTIMNKRIMRAATFNSSAHPCVVIVVLNKTLGDVLGFVISGVVTTSSIGIDVLTDVNVIFLAAVITAFEFMKPVPLCCPMTVFDCSHALQAWIPSDHLWSSFALPPLPQVLNQEPPGAQQLILPEFPIVPHLGHKEPSIVGVTIRVCM